ncbi:unnamed protein product [Closterium sp. NIES-53]
MALLRVLAFDHEGRPVAFDTWHDDLQLYLLSDMKDSVSLFDHVSVVAPAPPATADGGTRSQWLSRDATARLAIRNHLPVAECTHFGQHRTAQALYDTVVSRYSSPATTALGRLLLPYLFPGLSAFATVADLVTHLRTSDARYRATVPAECCSRCASGGAHAASPTISRLLATAVIDPSFESAAASALVAELLDFAAARRLDYATTLVAESVSASPPSVGGESALGTNVLEDRQEDFECLAAAWQAAMDAEMASWKSTGTYVDEVPPPGANIFDGMWIFRVKRLPGSPRAFKARYVTRGLSPRQGGDYFLTFSPTPKMTTLRLLLHVAAQHDYELHSLDFSTAFLQGSLHEEIWLRRPPSFTGTFPAGSQWSLRRPVYGLRQAPREWHDTLRITLEALGISPSTADPSLFLRTDTSLPPFYVLVLQRFGFQFSSPQPTPLSTSHMLSALPSDESVDPSGPYSELVGCLMYLMTCTRPDLAYPLSLLARYVAPGRHRKVHWDGSKRVLRYLCSTLGMGLVLGGWGPVVFTGHANASWVDDSATQRSSQGSTFSLGSGSVSWRFSAPVVRLRSTPGPWLHRSCAGSPTC